MRWHAVASVVPTALLAAIIAAIPVARAFGQGNAVDAAAAPAASGPTGAGALPQDRSAPNAGARTPGDAASPTTNPNPNPNPTPTETIVLTPRHAPARLVEVTSAPPPARRMVASLSHDLQFGLAVLLGDGYRGIFPYYDMIDCGDAKANENRVCTNRAPVFLDLQPSFGLSDRWDFLVDLRFGLTKDFNTYHQFFVMPGFRYWLDPQSQVKFFSTLQLAYDRSGQNNRPGAPHPISDNDLGVRNSNGLMVEVMRNLGVYFQFGETVGFYRWLSFAVDAGIGVQARVP